HDRGFQDRRPGGAGGAEPSRDRARKHPRARRGGGLGPVDDAGPRRGRDRRSLVREPGGQGTRPAGRGGPHGRIVRLHRHAEDRSPRRPYPASRDQLGFQAHRDSEDAVRMPWLKTFRPLLSSRLVWGCAILGLTSAAGSFFFGPLSAGVYQPAPGFSWFVPAAQGFATLASLSIALVCFGRYRAMGGAWLFWFGQLQLSAAVLGVFYVLAWLGSFNLGLGLGNRPSTFWWFGGLIAVTRGLSVAALGARRPRSLSAPAYRAAS